MKLKLDEYLISVLKNKKRVAFVGAGGKTSLIILLAKAFSKINKSVLISTTTKMIKPNFVFKNGNKMNYGENKIFFEPFNYKPKKGEIVFFASEYSERKVQSPEQEVLLNVSEWFDICLYEADGAKNCPIKIAKSYEPVILEKRDFTVHLTGLSAFGKELIEDNFYNSNKYKEIYGKSFLNKIDSIVIKNVKKLADNYSNIFLLNQGDLVDDIKIEDMLLCSVKENWIDV